MNLISYDCAQRGTKSLVGFLVINGELFLNLPDENSRLCIGAILVGN